MREAASRLGARCPALLVELGESRLGVVTDAEVRAAVRPRQAPSTRRFAASRVPRCRRSRSTQLAVEATIDMLASGTGALARARRRARVAACSPPRTCSGSTSAARSRVRHMILGARRRGRADPRRQPTAAAVPAPDSRRRSVARPRTGAQPAARRGRRPAGRLLDLAPRSGTGAVGVARSRERGPARVHAVLRPGQRARLRRPRAGQAESIDAYFEQLGAEVNDGLARCGIGVDNNGVLAGKRLWRMSKSDVAAHVRRMPRDPGRVAPDPRDGRVRLPPGGGRSSSSRRSSPSKIRAARQHPDFMRLMARSATGFPVALGFRGQLATGRGGDPPGRLDLKHGAIIPLVNLVRFHALANGVTISPTLDRIEAVASVGGSTRSWRRRCASPSSDHPAALRAPRRADRRRRCPRTTSSILTNCRRSRAANCARRSRSSAALRSNSACGRRPGSSASHHIRGRKCAPRTPLERRAALSTLSMHVWDRRAVHEDALLLQELGALLSRMLEQLSFRGPDSAGVAFYRDPAPVGSCKVSLHRRRPRTRAGSGRRRARARRSAVASPPQRSRARTRRS